MHSSLQTSGLLEAYNAVFQQQLVDGIIEQFEVAPADYDKFIWIPHRAVVKTADQVTSKVRPVFNCSLKTGQAPSLNEAAYPGADLMANLLQLLLTFRSEKCNIIRY